MDRTDRRFTSGILVVGLGVGLVVGCASAPSSRTGDLDALYRARTDSARTRFSRADVQFVTDMIAHHAQAIDMAMLVPARSASPAIGTLAGRIINAQRDEIAWMELWLRDRGQSLPEPGAAGERHDHMPGMVTQAQMGELEQSSGTAFDRLFLDLMIQHHRGAVAMVLALLDTDGAVQDPATFKLASDIHVDQTTEIARMELMLEALLPGDIR